MATSATLAGQRVMFEFAHEVQVRSQSGVNGAGEDTEFVSKNALKQFWTASKICQVVDKFLSAVTIRTEFIRVLSTLAHINRVDCLEEFTKYGLRDDLLPLINFPDHWPTSKVYHDLFNEFQVAQWRFFPLLLRRNQLENLHLHPNHILPWSRTRISNLDYCGESMIYKVEIAEGYNELSNVCLESLHFPPSVASIQLLMTDQTESRDGNNIFVLKSCFDKKLYENERQALALLKDSPNSHVVGFYGSFVQNDTYNLILEYVNGGTLLRLFQSTPPHSPHDIHDFWTSYTGIFKGAYRIHQLFQDREIVNICRIVHQDIKPENILLKRRPNSSPYQFELKIADFGYSHVRFIEPNCEDELAIDRQGGEMYSAPECCRNETYLRGTNKITAKADIFSIGCVTSDAAVWVAFGSKGRAAYRHRRQEENDKLSSFRGSNYGGCFHNGVEILQAVRDMHVHISEQLPRHDNVTASITRIAEDFMLAGQASKRANAREMKERFGHILDGYQSPTSGRSSTFDGLSSITKPLPSQQQLESPAEKSISNELSTANCSPPQSVGSLAVRNGSSWFGPIMYPSAPSTPASDIDQQRQSFLQGFKISVRRQWSSLFNAILPSHKYGPARPRERTESLQNRPWLTLDQALDYREKRRTRARVDAHVEEKIHCLMRPLQGRDHVFLIDDSSTMAARAKEVLGAFETMSYIAKQIHSDGIGLAFASNCSVVAKQTATKPLVKLLKSHQYSLNKSLMELSMDDFTDQVLIPRLRGLLRGQYTKKPVKPISVFVFTDGSWGEGLQKAAGVERPIHRLIATLIKHEIPRTKIMFQFIRFGDSSDGLRYLNYLDKFGREQGFDIVDTEPWPCGDLRAMFIGSLSEEIWQDSKSHSDAAQID